MALVEIHQLTKQYTKGDQTITPLEDAELQIQEHEFVSLMGASGSGKSTLLNMIAGIDRPLLKAEDYAKYYDLEAKIELDENAVR